MIKSCKYCKELFSGGTHSQVCWDCYVKNRRTRSKLWREKKVALKNLKK